MKIKTSELIGPALDWAVAKCEGEESYAAVFYDEDWLPMVREPEEDLDFQTEWKPSTDWEQGGPIIERERICIDQPDDLRIATTCQAFIRICVTGQARRPHYVMDGPTPLVAAMRCHVASKLGDEVDIPVELL